MWCDLGAYRPKVGASYLVLSDRERVDLIRRPGLGALASWDWYPFPSAPSVFVPEAAFGRPAAVLIRDIRAGEPRRRHRMGRGAIGCFSPCDCTCYTSQTRSAVTGSLCSGFDAATRTFRGKVSCTLLVDTPCQQTGGRNTRFVGVQEWRDPMGPSC